jgi:sigma-B regulation protein RsbU (phosphoserine phosphatase)
VSQADPDKTEVVVAEDSGIQAKMLRKRLIEAGYEVRVGINGREALELIRQRPPQIVISDIEMPEMNGFELCRTLKSDPQFKRIPLILLSTLSSPEDIIQGLHAGADNYVTKPYDAQYLLSRVRSLLDTPIGDDDSGPALEVTLAGKRYQVKSGRQQVLNLLISTFENAVEKNNELIRVNQELTLAKDELTKSNQELAALNGQLESANTRMTRDLDAAAKVQQSLLPTTNLDAPRLRGAWKYIPCDELAGDFLNFFALDDQHVALFVVDVSGHGVASSLLSVTIARVLTPQVSASSLLVRLNGDQRQIVPPREVAAELNRRFPMENQGGLYFTLLYGIFNTQTREFRYTSAGHDPPLYVPRDEAPRFLPAEGFPIGWMDDMDYDEEALTLAPGDQLFLYSDGVPEAMDEQLNEFGEERMVEVISRSRTEPVIEGVAKLCDSVETWCRPKGLQDDVSILAVEVPSCATPSPTEVNKEL